MNGLVTVLVVTYNHKGLLRRCLDSILRQKVDFRFRVIIADDASTDGTSDIVREYAARYDNIEPIIRPVNLGVARSIGDAYNLIATPYFIITEGDDYWVDDLKLQKQIVALKAHPECSFCAHRTRIVNCVGETIGTVGPELGAKEKVFVLRKAPFCHTTSRLYRNFLPELSDEDRHFIWRDTYIHYAALDRGPMVYLNEEMSVYNITGEGVWTSRSEKEQSESNRLEAFQADQFLGFRHTLILRKKYLPEEPRRLFSMAVPLNRKWKIRFSMDRISSKFGKEVR